MVVLAPVVCKPSEELRDSVFLVSGVVGVFKDDNDADDDDEDDDDADDDDDDEGHGNIEDGEDGKNEATDLDTCSVDTVGTNDEIVLDG